MTCPESDEEPMKNKKHLPSATKSIQRANYQIIKALQIPLQMVANTGYLQHFVCDRKLSFKSRHNIASLNINLRFHARKLSFPTQKLQFPAWEREFQRRKPLTRKQTTDVYWFGLTTWFVITELVYSI